MQELWAAWSDAECNLEATAVMGSAEAFIGYVCH